MASRLIIEGDQEATQYQLVAVTNGEAKTLCEFPVTGRAGDVEARLKTVGTGTIVTITVDVKGVAPVQEAAPVEKKPVRKRRKRRTKAEIEAAKKAEAGASSVSETSGYTETTETPKTASRRDVAAAAVAAAKAVNKAGNSVSDETSDEGVPGTVLNDLSTVLNEGSDEDVDDAPVAAGATPY